MEDENNTPLRRSIRKPVPSKRIYDETDFKDNGRARYPTSRDKMELSREEKRQQLKQCVCGKTNDQIFMIFCELCKIWYHGDCIGVS
jgi:hypothetical protein